MGINNMAANFEMISNSGNEIDSSGTILLKVNLGGSRKKKFKVTNLGLL